MIEALTVIVVATGLVTLAHVAALVFAHLREPVDDQDYRGAGVPVVTHGWLRSAGRGRRSRRRSGLDV